jgi:Permuted papain-like amidase enzyme, YaeF/YiiX, C92 family
MRILLFSIIFSLLSSFVLAQDYQKYLQEGDLVFQDLDCGPLCDAIEAVTEGYQGRDFSHVAMLVKINGELRALEAIGTHVKSTSIDSLFLRCPNPAKYLVMRLIPEYKSLIPRATKYALSNLGKAYDDRFIMNNDSLYCSELIYHAYESHKKNTRLFYLQPMTYKDPITKEFYPAWVDYYKSLNSFIPEGLLGINPGIISRSPYLQVVEIK